MIVRFLGDEDSAPRQGIITTVFGKMGQLVRGQGGIYAVVMWDTDEYTAIENGKEVVCFDTGVATFPLDSLQNKERYLLIALDRRKTSS